MAITRELGTMIKYGAVGVGNTLTTAAIMALLSLTGLPYPVYSALAYVVGMVQSYILNRIFTFSTPGSPQQPPAEQFMQVLKFGTVSLLCLALAQAVQAAARELALLPLWLSLGIGMAGYTALGYVLNRLWVFNNTRIKDGSTP